ncbi:MAG: hypothetical protein EOP36_18095 [Rubrivivax sp.]|nr:MAG: hypothetical protein EOP36_18095 [Rubrivivax sp.]
MVPDHCTPGPAPVFRCIALPVEVFDYLKQTQRRIQETEGHRLSNNRLIARLLLEHKATTAADAAA